MFGRNIGVFPRSDQVGMEMMRFAPLRPRNRIRIDRRVRSVRSSLAKVGLLGLVFLLMDVPPQPDQTGQQVRFPANQFGQADLALPQSLEHLESTLLARADNFELIGRFSEQHPIRKLSQGVGRLDLLVDDPDGGKWLTVCTAWLVSREYILTNYHCFLSKTGRRLSIKDARFRLGYLFQRTEPGDDFPVSPEPLESNESLDYAILRVDGDPADKYAIVPWAASDPSPGEELLAIHHPLGKPLRVTRRFCRVVTRSAVTDVDFRHRCDTMPGSSGAPIFSELSHMAVGLHYQGGLDETPQSYNSAKRLKIIVATSEILAELQETPVGDPGLYLTVEGKKGQLLTPGMIRVVTDSRGSLPDDGARPTSYKRDLAGTCLVRDMEHGTGLQWSDIGALC